MKKLILFLILLFTLDLSAQVTRASLWEWVSAQIIQSRTGVTSVLPSATNAVNFGASGTIWNYGYFDTTVTNHLANTTWTLNSVAVTSTGTQLNYLSGATGTTGTTTTNLVFSTSPVLVTPTLGVAIGTSLALGGATIGANALAVTGTSDFAGTVTGTFGATSKLLLDGSTTGHTDTAGLLDINMSPTAAATGTVMADLALTSPSAGFGATTHYGINLSFTGDADDNASSIVQLIQMGFTPNTSPATVYGLYGNDSDLDYFIFEDGGAPVRFDGIVYAMNNANALQLGDDASDTDIVMNWKANTSDGTITFMEDEDRFDFDNDVKVTGEILAGDGAAGAPSISFYTSPTTGLYNYSGGNLGFAVGGVAKFLVHSAGMRNAGYYSFGETVASEDVFLYRIAANILAQKNGANAQTFRLYDEDNTGANDRYTNLGWLADSSFAIDLDISGSKTQRPMAFTGFTNYTTDAPTGNTAHQPITLGASATTFAVTKNVITVTGDAGANVIATITGAVVGVYTFIFVDGLVTITDNDAHNANSVDLAGTATNFTSADDKTLQLVFDGTSWYQVGTSTN